MTKGDKNMTVQDLINTLSECNPELEVVIKDDDLAMEITGLDGYDFRDGYVPPNGSTYPCIGIEIGNAVGVVQSIE